MLNTFTFQFSFLLKWSLTDWTFQLPTFFFTTPAFHLKNPLKIARVRLGEGAIGYCLTFRESGRAMAAWFLNINLIAGHL